VCDNAAEVSEHLHVMPTCFREAMEDGIQQGAASALAVVHSRFSNLVVKALCLVLVISDNA
jgi:hypothetical protein